MQPCLKNKLYSQNRCNHNILANMYSVVSTLTTLNNNKGKKKENRGNV